LNSEYALNILDSAAKDKELNQDLREFFIHDKLLRQIERPMRYEFNCSCSV